MKKALSLMLAAVLVLCCFAACGGNGGNTDATTPGGNTTVEEIDFSAEGDYTANNTKYVIGATGPLTGDFSSYGISVQNGANLAIKEINAAGGLDGVEFVLNMKDEQGDPTKAQTAYTQLYEEGMQVSIGSVTSGAAESFATEAANDSVFSLTPSASAATVIAASDYSFRVCFGDPDQGVLAADKLSEEYKNIGVIYDNSDTYSSGIYDAFKTEMEKLGTKYIEQSFDKENKRDFSTQVEALKDCDVIFLPIYYAEAGLIAKACVSKGCTAALFGCDGLDGVKDQIDASVLEHNKVSYITPFDVNSTEENVAKFVAAYKADYDGALPDQFAADGYDAVYAIYNAMKELGVNNVKVAPDALGTALKDAFAAGFQYKGVTGEMTWDATGACAKPPIIVEVTAD